MDDSGTITGEAKQAVIPAMHAHGHGIRRRLGMSLAGIVIARGSLGLTAATPVAAAGGTATSYGFVCSTNGWVRNNFPHMTSISGGIERVYFWSDLYRLNTSST